MIHDIVAQQTKDYIESKQNSRNCHYSNGVNMTIAQLEIAAVNKPGTNQG